MFTVLSVVWAVMFILSLALIGAVVYVAWHFIQKFW